MMEAASLEKCLPLQPFIFPASTALHQDRDMETCSDSAGAKQGSAFPGDPVSQNRGGTGRAVHWQRGSEQQTPVVLLTHPWKPIEQQGVISQESGPLDICHLLFD